MKQANLLDLLKEASKTVCTSPVVISPDPFSPTPLTSSAMKTSENTEGDPDDTEQADGDIQIEYSSEWLYSPSIESVTRVASKNLDHYRYCLIIRNI